MSKDQILYAKRYANEIEYNNFHMFATIMFALFNDDKAKYNGMKKELQLNREDLYKVLDTLYNLLKLGVGDIIDINGVEIMKDYEADDDIYRLIKDFKRVLEENPFCNDFKFTNY